MCIVAHQARPTTSRVIVPADLGLQVFAQDRSDEDRIVLRHAVSVGSVLDDHPPVPLDLRQAALRTMRVTKSRNVQPAACRYRSKDGPARTPAGSFRGAWGDEENRRLQRPLCPRQRIGVLLERKGTIMYQAKPFRPNSKEVLSVKQRKRSRSNPAQRALVTGPPRRDFR